jgi:hypothetical protein
MLREHCFRVSLSREMTKAVEIGVWIRIQESQSKRDKLKDWEKIWMPELRQHSRDKEEEQGINEMVEMGTGLRRETQSLTIARFLISVLVGSDAQLS